MRAVFNYSKIKLFIYSLNSMILKQTVIISSASTIILILFTSVAVYFYSSYARPETVHPTKLKDDLKKRDNSISDVMSSIKKRFPDNLWIRESANDSGEKVITDLGPQDALKDNKIKEFFKKVANSSDNRGKAPESGDIEKIIPIKFPPLQIPEAPEKEVPKSFRASNEVFIGQVGLSLYTDNYFAAVYRIQNLFGKSGLVGHYFVINPNLDRVNFEKEKVTQINFSTRENFKKYFQRQQVTEIPSSSTSKTSIILINSKILDTETFKLALEPEINGEEIVYINPYKWLHLSTLLKSKFSTSHPAIHALIFPQDETENQEGILYPSDVRVFELDWIKTADLSLHSGCVKRIQNHCRDYFGKGEISL